MVGEGVFGDSVTGFRYCRPGILIEGDGIADALGDALGDALEDDVFA